jgi:Asp/Glu/hydantoin racemase
MKRVGIIHTSFVSLDHLKGLFKEIVPDAELVNVVDDSLLAEVMKNGHVTPQIVGRYCSYALHLEKSVGVDLILNQCSSVGEVADIARSMVQIPIVKIDEAMAEKAVQSGTRISVVATVASTMGPSVRLVEAAGKRLGKTVRVAPHLVDGALDILMKQGDRETHNRLVLEKIAAVEGESDVIVLAQGSMVVLIPFLGAVHVPVLTSPRLAVERVRDVLNGK